AHLTFTSSTADLASGSTRALTVEIHDAAGNLETGDDATSVTFAKDAGPGTVTGLGSATSSGGVARMSVTGALAGSVTITASAGSLTSGTTTLTIVAGAADHLVFSSSAGGLASGHTRTLTVEIRDSGGNLVAADNSTVVTFAKKYGAGTITGLGSATATN